MRTSIAHLWRHHKLLLLAFVVAALVTLAFAVRTIMFALYWSDPAHRRQQLEAWMPLRYVAYSWQLDPARIAAAFGVEDQQGRRLTVGQIAARKDLTLEQMKQQLEALAPPSGGNE